MAKMDDAESRRIRIDILKHLTTLNTGSILIAAAMLDKFPKGNLLLLAGTFTFLLTSLILCVLLLITYDGGYHHRHNFIAAGVLFILGIAMMSTFVSKGFHDRIGPSPTTYIKPHN